MNNRLNSYAPWPALALVIAVVLLCTGPASAQTSPDYPTRPVRVIVATAAGGATDLQARMFSQKLSESLKQQFVVENRPGGNYVPGYGSIAKAAPDGYTLLSAAAAFTIVPTLNPGLPDAIRDYAPISLVTKAPYLLMSHPALPVKSPRDMITLAKAKPGALAFGVGARGSTTHLAAVLMAMGAKINLNIIPYKGGGQITIDVMAGNIQVCFGNVLNNMPHVKSGRLRALGVTGATRSTVLPLLPTVAESGVPGYDVTTWHGWLAPSGTPMAIINKLSEELARAVKSQDIAARLAEDGGEPTGSSPEEFRRLIANEVPRWRKIIKEAGVTGME